ncbi:acetyl-CoA carboxylase biotin carboxylase subunit [Virgibacillus proomii]|uniref:acetyl-CoA carboxylase biotin carboxylase subunit n=1 Tax=Virgibacillus proomii TaxID=84407 RepID=UPI001C120CCF|nr:acetyl-CoA carboxylase biotin carboxylase subunit [Virgibacillus proomii]MBU5266388.1 acetyl-CoA carboxylase biotin carboxylase subunit [Virgibacillus proomii]
MISKIVIANRGEIAVRIIRTCKKLNIKTVSVYSEADKHAPHVKLADQSYCIGPPRVNESYLNANRIIEIAKQANAEAVHPGYGFLSESATFAEQCEQAGILFIGPSSNVIRQMGSKIAARKAMQQARVPIVPGTEEAVASTEEAIRLANQIGYPVMVKASSGGGGIGMQTVYSEAELTKAFENNAKRAKSFFGDGSMFIEKKIENARHIEIQVLADQFGHVVHLFERECSIQRRNQKVIEEAPSPFITEQTRKEMGEKAVQAAKALHYTNAGTIEFLVDEQENFYFLEMNTRIQVEHPITEEITGIDIIEKQIDIANGKPLTIEQHDLNINGHAIEARIYAEDPLTFFPSPGQIEVFHPPSGEKIRNEVGVTNNYLVSPFYDPMIAKLIVHGETREKAITLLKQALDQYEITGIKTNLSMLMQVIDHEQFKAANTTTNFIESYYLPKKIH